MIIKSNSMNTTVSNGDICFLGLIVLVLDLHENIKSLDNPSKSYIFPVQMNNRSECCDIKLRLFSIWEIISMTHTNYAQFVMLGSKTLVIKLSLFEAGTRCKLIVTLFYVTALNKLLLNNSTDLCIFITMLTPLLITPLIKLLKF